MTYSQKSTSSHNRQHCYIRMSWPYTGCTPYDILGVPHEASVAELRRAFRQMALCTHPDKHAQLTFSSHGTSNTSSTVPPFHLVMEAGRVLLDPMERVRYDRGLYQASIRDVGAVSEVCNLADDFMVQVQSDVSSCDASATSWCVYTRECRCGGTYELIMFSNDDDFDHDDHAQKTQSCHHGTVDGVSSGDAVSNTQLALISIAGRSSPCHDIHTKRRASRRLCECDCCSLVVEVCM